MHSVSTAQQISPRQSNIIHMWRMTNNMTAISKVIVAKHLYEENRQLLLMTTSNEMNNCPSFMGFVLYVAFCYSSLLPMWWNKWTRFFSLTARRLNIRQQKHENGKLCSLELRSLYVRVYFVYGMHVSTTATTTTTAAATTASSTTATNETNRKSHIYPMNAIFKYSPMEFHVRIYYSNTWRSRQEIKDRKKTTQKAQSWSYFWRERENNKTETIEYIDESKSHDHLRWTVMLYGLI